MIAWPSPHVPELASYGRGPLPCVHDDARGEKVLLQPGPVATVYVCGITPYDATHLGHAATYVTFDVLNRVLRDAGHQVLYAQNVTDVDDPLLERAKRDGMDWRDLATREIQLFRDDMSALAVIPPQHYVGVVESVAEIGRSVLELLASGAAYRIGQPEAGGEGVEDIYLDLAKQPQFGKVSGWSEDEMLAVFADRGGDPERAGKRGVFDPLLWRAARAGEPSWQVAGLVPGRPGWHIECTSIATRALGTSFDVQGGGSDLVFPHHEMSAVQAKAAHGPDAFASVYLHQAMVGLDGEKMSKSKGNLVLVSVLRRAGVDPMAIRLGLLAHHYRTPWDWTDEVLDQARHRLQTWRAAAANCPRADQRLVDAVRNRLADDLDTPGALAVLDDWAAAVGAAETAAAQPSNEMPVAAVLDALLGVQL
ncbi:cysteine--1-D-myo-inosityl 2-amino-2-deoxy-alpha-D-glucopyranoside ligase [Gephyromycinifex aptenodytis]|uniref:cysteine--1-D-myo-inosityl 2-amino-2-deoxy-alpha-D-glucopyranoside ligase n=1 Tax=Gephyromycinifex aptenodytis TaxID=2716227 RepID=UPI00144601BF|nr:cysteine--1-D-myo-inosityl 2-amino-2-deoxy-alpha-D-glucopyranoside ligase [Gephyromycinifex aptenodytis]